LVSASSSGLPESASSVEEELMGEKITLADVMDGKSTMRFYACFWSLQDYFRNPLTLLSKDDFIQFKRRLQISLAVFKELYAQDNRPHSNSSSILPPAVTAMQSTKDSNYVPKYLTSSNLFRLQLSDLTFRRSFLLQSLVILRFLQQSFASRKSVCMHF
jgi:THO complex subunit 1